VNPWWLVLIIPGTVLGTIFVSMLLQMWFWRGF